MNRSCSKTSSLVQALRAVNFGIFILIFLCMKMNKFIPLLHFLLVIVLNLQECTSTAIALRSQIIAVSTDNCDDERECDSQEEYSKVCNHQIANQSIINYCQQFRSQERSLCESESVSTVNYQQCFSR